MTKKILPIRNDFKKNHNVPGKHFSEVFYEEVKALGYSYALRPHGGARRTDNEMYALNSKEEMYEIEWVKSWQEWGGFKGYTEEPYHSKIEHVILGHSNDGRLFVIGYFADLTTGE